MGAVWSILFGKSETPIKPGFKGWLQRIKNIERVHFRGIFGGFAPVIILFIYLILEAKNKKDVVNAMWVFMGWTYFMQPVNIPVTGMVPIFLLPMTCSMSTDKVVGCYMNEGIILFIVGNMLLLLWNNSGLDRRVILWFLAVGDPSQSSPMKMILKCSAGGFFVSILSNRLIVCNIMIQYVEEVLTSYQSYTAKGGPDMEKVKFILLNSIQTSCAIGGIAMVHSSYATLAFRAIFNEVVPKEAQWPDIFNYLEYLIFAFPTALVMLIVNMIYHMVIIRKSAKGMTPALLRRLGLAFKEHKKTIPKKLSVHEILTLVFSILALAAFILRYSKYWSGWSGGLIENKVPLIRDATVAVIFVVLLHALPSGFRFAKLWLAKKKSKFGPLKPESAILWWRFVDKNITYGYIFVIGSGVALGTAMIETKLNEEFKSSTIGKLLNEQSTEIYFLIISFVAVFSANIMSGVPSVAVLMPCVMHLAVPKPAGGDAAAAAEAPPKLNKVYLGALAVGIGSSCGFVNPFLYTPAYFFHYTGKVRRRYMAMYGAGSAVLCFLILFIFITFYAPVLWGTDINVEKATGGETTTPGGGGVPPDQSG